MKQSERRTLAIAEAGGDLSQQISHDRAILRRVAMGEVLSAKDYDTLVESLLSSKEVAEVGRAIRQPSIHLCIAEDVGGGGEIPKTKRPR